MKETIKDLRKLYDCIEKLPITASEEINNVRYGLFAVQKAIEQLEYMESELEKFSYPVAIDDNILGHEIITMDYKEKTITLKLEW